MKRWVMGVYHGIRRKYLNIYLQEFVFRWNRRRHFSSSFDSLLTIGNGVGHSNLRQIVGRLAVLKNLMERVCGLSEEHRHAAYDKALLSEVVLPVENKKALQVSTLVTLWEFSLNDLISPSLKYQIRR